MTLDIFREHGFASDVSRFSDREMLQRFHGLHFVLEELNHVSMRVLQRLTPNSSDARETLAAAIFARTLEQAQCAYRCIVAGAPTAGTALVRCAIESLFGLASLAHNENFSDTKDASKTLLSIYARERARSIKRAIDHGICAAEGAKPLTEQFAEANQLLHSLRPFSLPIKGEKAALAKSAKLSWLYYAQYSMYCAAVHVDTSDAARENLITDRDGKVTGLRFEARTDGGALAISTLAIIHILGIASVLLATGRKLGRNFDRMLKRYTTEMRRIDPTSENNARFDLEEWKLETEDVDDF